MIRRVVAFTGTARPRPTPATAVLIPTTRDCASASAPPELPGFSAASVWITSSTSRAAAPLRVGSDRPTALTTPAVTEPARPSGLPTATTSWPTTSLSASQSSAAGSVGPLITNTARSDSGSAPTTVNVALVPSENSAVPPWPRPTTWALVSRNPSPVNTTAEPRLSPPLPPPRWGTRRLATLGVSSAATPETTREYASRSPDSISSSCSRYYNINHSRQVLGGPSARAPGPLRNASWQAALPLAVAGRRSRVGGVWVHSWGASLRTHDPGDLGRLPPRVAHDVRVRPPDPVRGRAVRGHRPGAADLPYGHGRRGPAVVQRPVHRGGRGRPGGPHHPEPVPDAEGRRSHRAAARAGRGLGRRRQRGEPAGGVAAARPGQGTARGLAGRRRAGRGVGGVGVLARRRHHRLVRTRPAAGLQRSRLRAVRGGRALRLRGSAPSPVPAAHRVRRAAGRLRDRRWCRHPLPRDRVRRGGVRGPRQGRVLRGQGGAGGRRGAGEPGQGRADRAAAAARCRLNPGPPEPGPPEPGPPEPRDRGC